MSAITYRPPSEAILTDFKRMLRNFGYSSHGVSEEPPTQPNPTFGLVRDQKSGEISLVIIGNACSYMAERAMRFFRDARVLPQQISVFDLNTEDRVLLVSNKGNQSLYLQLQSDLDNHQWDIYDFKFVVRLGSSPRVPSIDLKPAASLPPRFPFPSPIKGGPSVAPFKPSPVMLKSRKLSQLKRREEEDIDFAPQNMNTVPGQDLEATQEEILNSLSESPLNESEKAILREIIQHPKRKVQSNHIRKKTGLDQEVIRNTLRDLVSKNILRVSSGWYILKKSIAAPLASRVAAEQALMRKPLVRSEARERRLKAQMEAESFGQRDQEEGSYKEKFTPGEGMKLEEYDTMDVPFDGEQEFWTPAIEDDDSNSRAAPSLAARVEQKASGENGKDDYEEDDDFDDSEEEFNSDNSDDGYEDS